MRNPGTTGPLPLGALVAAMLGVALANAQTHDAQALAQEFWLQVALRLGAGAKYEVIDERQLARGDLDQCASRAASYLLRLSSDPACVAVPTDLQAFCAETLSSHVGERILEGRVTFEFPDRSIAFGTY
jgi:hypothetical protein